MNRIGVDIGGTFTDFALHRDGAPAVAVHKRLTTYPDPAEGVLAGLDELVERAGLRPEDVDLVIHATTLATNALIERRGARVGLVTTRGFRDVLELGREQRYDIYDLFLRFPEPLVPRRLRREVTERVDARGDVLVPLDEGEAEREAAALAREGVESLAVVFLHAYRNPAHERAARAAARRAAPGLYVSLSSEVAPEVREYERASTTVANAYVQPLVDRYLARLERELDARGFRGRFVLMHSAGGVMAPASARALPVRLLESGPAAGVLAAAYLGRRTGRGRLISFDMGGTTAKIALVRDGRPELAPGLEVARVHRFKAGSGLPVRGGTVDLLEIGAGGGSIASVTRLGTLQVGPRSAGADPGPACYGRGGRLPTVTDADLLLGYLNPEYFLAGRLRLDVAAARAAVAAHVAGPLGVDVTAAAWGIHRVVNEQMANAVRVHAVEKGEDPRSFALFAFGGAGPVHAAGVARLLGIREVVIPPAAGVASALGLVAAAPAFEAVRSVPALLAQADTGALARAYAELEEAVLRRLAEVGVDPREARLERLVDARYAGQFHELTVPLDGDAAGLREAIAEAFAREYRRRYGHLVPGASVQLLTLRVRGTGPEPGLDVRGTDRGGGGGRLGAGARKGSRPVYLPEQCGFAEVPVYERSGLAAGDEVAGPAVIEEPECTTVLGPGDRAQVDPWGQLVIRVRG